MKTWHADKREMEHRHCRATADDGLTANWLDGTKD